MEASKFHFNTSTVKEILLPVTSTHIYVERPMDISKTVKKKKKKIELNNRNKRPTSL